MNPLVRSTETCRFSTTVQHSSAHVHPSDKESRTVQHLASAQNPYIEIPQEFICSITYDILEDPHITICEEKHTHKGEPSTTCVRAYSKKAIEEYISRCVAQGQTPKDPMNGQKILSIAGDYALNEAISSYRTHRHDWETQEATRMAEEAKLNDPLYVDTCIPALKQPNTTIASSYLQIASTYEANKDIEHAQKKYLKALEFSQDTHTIEQYLSFLSRHRSSSELKLILKSLTVKYEQTDLGSLFQKFYDSTFEITSEQADALYARIMHSEIHEISTENKYSSTPLAEFYKTQKSSAEIIEKCEALYYKTFDRDLLDVLVKIYRYGPEEFYSVEKQIPLFFKDLEKNPDDLRAHGSYQRYLRAFEKNIEADQIRQLYDAAIIRKHGHYLQTLHNQSASKLLEAAIKDGKVAEVRDLIQKGVNINEATSPEKMPLSLAIDSKNLEIIRLLLDVGADFKKSSKSTELIIDIKDHLGKRSVTCISDYNTTLYKAISKDSNDSSSIDIIKLLLSYGEYLNRHLPISMYRKMTPLNPLLLAIHNGSFEIVRLLVEMQSTLEHPGLTYDSNINLLSYSTRKLKRPFYEDTIKIIELLISKGWDLDTPNQDGHTPLWNVIISRNDRNTHSYKRLTEPMFKSLIEAGADINVTDKDNNTLLMKACKFSDHSCFDILLAKGANINSLNKKGQNALEIALKYTNKKSISKLIEAGADINVIDEDKNTLLMKACMKGDSDRVNILLAIGADLNLRNHENKNALEIALESNNERIISKMIHAHEGVQS